MLTACECARLALVHIPAGEDRPRLAIETAEKWAHGDPAVTLTMVRAAASAAAAADAADAADTADTTARESDAPRAQCCEIVRRHITVEMIVLRLTAIVKGAE